MNIVLLCLVLLIPLFHCNLTEVLLNESGVSGVSIQNKQSPNSSHEAGE